MLRRCKFTAIAPFGDGDLIPSATHGISAQSLAHDSVTDVGALREIEHLGFHSLPPPGMA